MHHGKGGCRDHAGPERGIPLGVLLYVVKTFPEFLRIDPYTFQGKYEGRQPQSFQRSPETQMLPEVMVIVDKQADGLAPADVHTVTSC